MSLPRSAQWAAPRCEMIKDASKSAHVQAHALDFRHRIPPHRERKIGVNLFEASNLAKQLMQQHGLIGWSFSFDHAKRRFGCCNYTHRRITLSKSLTFLNSMEEVRDTLLHEIAHALAPGDHHGPRWRAVCRQIGARPVRCYTDEKVVSPPQKPAPFLFGCPRCEWWVERRRVSRRKYQCAKCRGFVVFRERAIPVLTGVPASAGTGTR